MIAMADERPMIAHLLRRTTFGPFPGEVEQFANYATALTTVLGATPVALQPPALGSDDDEKLLTQWWLERVATPGTGLGEKMTWFWHGHFTSGFDKVREARFLWGQHQLLRANALGNFRDLVRGVTIDAAMLQYLDGQTSTGAAPNENYGRELMELFTLGRGSYTEADVRAAAKALAGWTIDDHGKVRFDATRAYSGNLTFLGRTGRFDANRVVDAVCAHPACAPYIAGKIHRFLVGNEPPTTRLGELAQVFRAADLNIRPLVENILRDPSFLTSKYQRPRQPVEWLTAAGAVLGKRPDGLDALQRLGQVPFHPPNVGGWGDPARTLTAGPTLLRAATAHELADDTIVSDSADPATAVLARCAIFDPSTTTLGALRSAAAAIGSRRVRATVLYALAVCSPEFVMA